MNTIQNRIEALRLAMKQQNVDAWYISGTDPHSNEYLPKRWQTREFISGFTGSNGIVVVTKTDAALWTDSRYFLQAEQQLAGTGISMKKLHLPDSVLPEIWLTQKLESGSRVGIDGESVSVAGFKNLRNTLAEKKIELLIIPDLLNEIWEDRPLPVDDSIFELELKFAGVSRREKQAVVAEKLKEKGAGYHVVAMLDELAWLFNLRGSDIAYNPVFIGFGLISERENYLFVDQQKLPEQLTNKLQNEGIIIKNYFEFYSFLKEQKGTKIYLDPNTTNYSIFDVLKEKNEIVTGTSIIATLKAVKNNTELAGIKNAMIKDGVAMVEFHVWLKENAGESEITEFVAGQKLREFRAKQNNFIDESFPPIVGYKAHGAIVHLSAGKDDALPIEADGILLFDSGAQYRSGTTDITRTVALGKVTEQQKLDYTYVLKGMINLTLAKFPQGTKGCHLDILARKSLWENGLDYGHGTGHGVGHFLNVHEAQMSIRKECAENMILRGMVTSNEPAFYREGEYGIRTENLMVCVECEETEFGKFLGFETLTLCPIDTSLIQLELLAFKEKEWLNNYHRLVNKKLKPLLPKELHAFLDDSTKEI
jgi:Xaa-Pro aminopeptidase